MAPARRRVSYVIPPPLEPIPRLRLPPPNVSRLGSVAPLLLLSKDPADKPAPEPRQAQHPRHRLGVAALALDTSTQLEGRHTPEGILYTGGRDGLVISWDLGIPMQKRKYRSGLAADDRLTRSVGRWEMLTGWGDDVIEEEGEDGEERAINDGDILGDVQDASGRSRKRSIKTEDAIPYEDRWETDMDSFSAGKRTLFRQCAQSHTEWVNDILLCNYNQTVISASSDGTVKAWNPHSANSPSPATIGVHNDYVRCLAHCREQNWIASGSFDRTIKLWDLTRTTRPGTAEPLMTLAPPDPNAPKSSIYAIATDPFGHCIASGSPERVIRTWDPRSGKRTGKLVGHTDNIRAILISEDSKYLLTGSADASIKLWSLVTQRCLHTFIHHTESVWSLFSSHSSLETFYSGDKTGLVCRVDVEDCFDVSEGECIVLCRDKSDHNIASPEGINRIVAMDDNVLWTASGNSCIKRWRVPRRRAVRAAALAQKEQEKPSLPELPPSLKLSLEPSRTPSRTNTPVPAIRPRGGGPRNSAAPSIAGSLASDYWPAQRDRDEETASFGVPYASLVRLASANDPFTPYPSMARTRDPEVATLYSTASIRSSARPTVARSPMHTTLSHRERGDHNPGSARLGDDVPGRANTARAEFDERELAADAEPLCDAPDQVIKGDHGLVRSVVLNDRMHVLTVDTSGEVAVWDVVRCRCLGRYTPEDVAAAKRRGSSNGTSSGGDQERSPRETLEVIQESIEGEAVVVPWSSVDTKTGLLTVHITERCFEAEIYADEVGYNYDKHFTDESRLNIGRWVLRNLFLGFIKEQQHVRRVRERSTGDNVLPASIHRGNGGHHIQQQLTPPHKRSSSESSTASSTTPTGLPVLSAPEMTPAVLPSVPPAVASSSLLTPLIPLHQVAKEQNTPMPPTPGLVTPMPRHLRSQTSDNVNLTPVSSNKDSDYFTMRPRNLSVTTPAGPVATSEELAGWVAPGPKRSSHEAGPAQTPGTPGGLMGRLKSFGKNAGRKAGDAGFGSPSHGASGASDGLSVPGGLTQGRPTAKTPHQTLLAGPLSPPSSSECPTIAFHPQTTFIISEEDSPGWMTVYRGTVSTAHLDIHGLEEAMAMWLLECLLLNKFPPAPLVKISFVMLPWPTKDPEMQLPELLNTAQSKLTASRFLRVRKLTAHVQEKLEKLANSSNSGTPRTSQESGSGGIKPKPEDLYEILCNDTLLPLNMTLAAARQYVWRQAPELIMYYRKRMAASPHPKGSLAAGSQQQ